MPSVPFNALAYSRTLRGAGFIMRSATLDPISYSEALQAAGMPKAQADVIAKNQQASLDRAIELKNLATKADLRELELRMAAMKVEIIKWMFAMFLAFGAGLVALLK